MNKGLSIHYETSSFNDEDVAEHEWRRFYHNQRFARVLAQLTISTLCVKFACDNPELGIIGLEWVRYFVHREKGESFVDVHCINDWLVCCYCGSTFRKEPFYAYFDMQNVCNGKEN
jgi:hypothetical protein